MRGRRCSRFLTFLPRACGVSLQRGCLLTAMTVGIPLSAISGADPTASGQAAAERAAVAACHGDSLITERVNLNAGIYNERIQVNSPLSMEVPIGVNPGQFHECLSVRGVAPESANIAYREHEQACRERHLGAGRVRLVSEHTLKLAGADMRGYQECLRHGPAPDIEVSFPDER